MSKTTVIVEDKAFMAIFLASVEAYPSKYRPDMSRKPNGASPEGEVHGLLFGQRFKKGNNTIFNVTLAVPNQIVCERTENSITPSPQHIKHLLELTELFPTYELLGYFHSHPDRREEFHKKSSVNFSDEDQVSAFGAAREANNDLIEVIFGITCLERRSRIQPEFIDNYLIHNCCGVYKYSLACYKTLKTETRLLEVDNLICTVASGMTFVDFQK